MWKFHMIFSWSPLEIHIVYNSPLEPIFSQPLEVPYLQLPYLFVCLFVCFWNSSIKGALAKNASCLVAIKEGGEGGLRCVSVLKKFVTKNIFSDVEWSPKSHEKFYTRVWLYGLWFMIHSEVMTEFFVIVNLFITR